MAKNDQKVKSKTEVALTKQATLYRIIIRNRDNRILIHKTDTPSYDKAINMFDDLCRTEKYRIIELQYFDKDGACRTLNETKV